MGYLHKWHSAVVVRIDISVPDQKAVIDRQKGNQIEWKVSPIQLLVLHLQGLHCSEIVLTLVGNLLQRLKAS